MAEAPLLSQRGSATRTEPQSYMRMHHPLSNMVHLQIALRKFVPANGSRPVIWLSGVSHLGETNYYRALQKHLNAQDLVLFEGVKAQTGEDDPFPAKRPGVTATAHNDSDEMAPSLQATLAESLGLAFQLDAIDYTPRHFRHSDLSLTRIAQLMSEHTNALSGDQTVNVEFQALLELMDGNSMLGAIAGFGARLLGSSPKLRAFMRLMLIETIGRLDGDLAQMNGMPPELQRLMKVLIAARNETVIDDLRKELGRQKPPRSMSVFYGAAHMADLEKRLRSELHYQPSEDVWLTAITVDVQKGGLTPVEVELVRSTVKWQMDVLQSSKPARDK